MHRLTGWVSDPWLRSRGHSLQCHSCSYTYNGRLVGSCIWSIEWCHFHMRWMTVSPDFKGTPSFDVEYLKNNTRWTHCWSRLLIESDIWRPIELRHLQWPWSTCRVVSMTLSLNKCSLLFQSLTGSQHCWWPWVTLTVIVLVSNSVSRNCSGCVRYVFVAFCQILTHVKDVIFSVPSVVYALWQQSDLVLASLLQCMDCV